jgi:hypothetical protein
MATPLVYTKIISSFNHSKETFPNIKKSTENDIVLSGNNPFNIEIVYAHIMTMNIKKLYWHYSTEIYNKYYWGSNTSSASILHSGEVVKCELCGTTKSLDLPFEITKCRKLDQTILEHITGKIIDNVNCILGNLTINKNQIENILDKLSLLSEKFSKWCKFNRYLWNDFKYIMELIGSISFLNHLKLAEIKKLNNILENLKDNLDKIFLTIR